MKAIDFKYGGKHLSDYNFTICNIDSGNGISEVNTGSLITFNKVKNANGKSYYLTNTSFDECISTTFDICKNSEIYNDQDMKITESEYRDIVRWLNRKEYIKFNFINDEKDDEVETVYFYASFNLSKLYFNNDLIGIRCNMTTNAPYGYAKPRTINHTFSSNGSFVIVDTSDEIGYIYPDMVITCQSAGNLGISNALTNTNMIIKNVSANEVITIKGEPQIISTSKSTHNLANDFNYRFLSIGNTFANKNNTLTATLACQVAITYSPIIKDLY